ncbi:MAG: hypothetical protein K2Y02_07585 [Burkholderiaceae bacterium]|nr:hypothetical protein [Burkholderiaceae bacterium]
MQIKPFARRLLASLTVALCVGSASAPAAAQSTVVTFNDLGPVAVGAAMPDGYSGFDWGAAYYYMAPVAVSGNTTYVALSSTSTWIRRTDSAPFYFNGADFWSRRGLDATGDFYFVLYLKGKTVYNGLTDKKGGRMRFTGTPTLFKPNYTGQVDMIALAFDSNGKDWNHLAFDNFRFTPK